MIVVPAAARPASRIADFTWAEATGVVQSMAEARAAADGEGRSRAVVRRATLAPIARSGSMIRAIGRRRSDASPSRITGNTLASDEPGEKPKAGAGVAAVEDIRRLA